MVRQNYKKKIIILSISVIAAIIIIGAFVIGRYRRFPEVSSTDALISLPYLSWTPVGQTIDKKGVVKYDRTKAYPGINIFSNDCLYKCYLMDMSGNIVHTWSIKERSLHNVRMCKNGDLIAVFYDRALFVLDWDSNIKWVKRMRFHHDVAVAENNDIYTLISKDEWVFKSWLPFPIKNDYIVVLSPNGEIKREISLFSLLKNEISFRDLIKKYHRMIKPKNIKGIIRRSKNVPQLPSEIFRTNTIEIIDRDIPGLCKKGDLLISMAQLDLIAILDIKKEKVIWKWGQGELSKPHQPVLLKNGNILIFDNGVEKRYSRIVELNPLTKEIVWEYKSNPPGNFFSSSRGANQRLPNGNTLITESDKGHVFEVAPDGEVVWEFYDPEIKEDDKMRATIHRMMRITDSQNYPCLKNIHTQ